MTVAATPWLPVCGRGEVDAAIQSVVHRWASEWFVDGGDIHSTFTPHTAARRALWVNGGGTMVGCADGDLAKLGFAAAGMRGDLANMIDARAFEQLGKSICLRLIETFGSHESQTCEPVAGFADIDKSQQCYAVTPADRSWLLFLSLTPAAIVRARRGLANRRKYPVLGKLEDALASETCKIGGHLGSANLNAADVGSLAIGDVIMFDRKKSEAVPLVVNGTFPAMGSARIESDNGELRFGIETAVSL